jgi:hypothetical protein
MGGTMPIDANVSLAAVPVLVLQQQQPAAEPVAEAAAHVAAALFENDSVQTGFLLHGNHQHQNGNSSTTTKIVGFPTFWRKCAMSASDHYSASPSLECPHHGNGTSLER